MAGNGAMVVVPVLVLEVACEVHRRFAAHRELRVISHLPGALRVFLMFWLHLRLIVLSLRSLCLCARSRRARKFLCRIVLLVVLRPEFLGLVARVAVVASPPVCWSGLV